MESDWEMIQLVLPDKDSAPDYAAYSQHYAGDKGTWAEVSASTGHPQVYVAKGGHASFWSAGVSLLRDEQNGDGEVWDSTRTPGMIRVIDNDLWLRFKGYWGADWGSWFGPSVRGPVYREANDRNMWVDALYWMEGL